MVSDNIETGFENNFWAVPLDKLTVFRIDSEAVHINIRNREITGPVRGFGQLWRKTYKVYLVGVEKEPKEIIQTWKDNYPSFWPPGNRYFGSGAGMVPGEIATLNLAGPGGLLGPGGLPLIVTGIRVVYADEESFSFFTAQGHLYGGMIIFSSYLDACPVIQVQALIRAYDPLYELGMRIGILSKPEDQFWIQSLKNLAAHYGINKPLLKQTNELVDPTLQWREAKNVWYNAVIRTTLYIIFIAPFRWVLRKIRPQ